MCLVSLILCMFLIALLAVVAFVKTAIAVLPWTVSAMLTSVVIGVLVGRSLVGDLAKRAIVASILTSVLTFGTGYGLAMAIPFKAPAPLEPGENLVKFPQPTIEQIREHFPRHLLIWSLIGGGLTAVVLMSKINGQAAQLLRTQTPETTEKKYGSRS